MFQLILTIGTAFLEILFLDGAVVGWPSLQFVLQQEGYFKYLCPNDVLNANLTNLLSTPFPELNTFVSYTNSGVTDLSLIISTTTSSPRLGCDAQEASFNLVYTLWLSAMFICSFPVGWLFDRLALTWIYRCIGASCFTLSFLLLTISEPATSALLYPSMILMAVSGYSLLVSNYQLANLAKSGRNATITAMNGVMDSAVAAFLLIKKGHDFGTKLHTIFLSFTLLTLFIWVRTFLLMPQKVIYYPIKLYPVLYGWKEWKCFSKPEISEVASEKRTDGVKSVTGDISAREKGEDSSNVQASDEKIVPFLTCIKNKLLWSSILHLSLLNLRLSIFLGTVLQWLEALGESESNISKYVDDFLIILIFAVCAAPLNGILVDIVTNHAKSSKKTQKVCDLRGSLASMIASSCLGIIMSVVVLAPSIYGSFILYLLLTGFVFGGAVTFIMVHFPAEHLGKLVGIQFSCIGIVNLFQYALYRIAAAVDPSFYYINISMLVISVITLIHPVLIWFEMRKHSN